MLIMYFNNVYRTIHLTGKGGDSNGKIDLSISVIVKITITAFISLESVLGLSQYFCSNLFLFGFPSDPFPLKYTTYLPLTPRTFPLLAM